MNSRTTREFWKRYDRLPRAVQLQARVVYSRWRKDARHPSLNFKCVNARLGVYSIRVGASWRALGLVRDNTVTWFWIGSHAEYDKLLREFS